MELRQKRILKFFPSFSIFSPLLFILYLAIFPPSVLAFDEGGGTTSIEYRTLNQETFTSKINLYETNTHLDIWQNVPNVGKLILSLDWVNANNGEDVNRLGRGYLSLEGVRFKDFLISGLLGDSSVLFANLPEKFSNSTFIDIYFRGFKTDLVYQRGDTHFFAGKVARLEGMFGKIYDPTDEIFYGFKSRYRPVPWLLLGAGMIRTQDEVNSADQPVTKNNLIFLFDSELEIFKWMKWLTEFRRSDFHGAQGIESQKDYALKFGPLLKTENLRLEANYRRIGTDYHFVNESTQGERDQEGFFLLTEYRPWKEFSLFGNTDLFRNNVSKKPDRNTTDSKSGLIGLSFFKPKYPSFAVTFDMNDQRTRFDLPSPVDTLTMSLFSEIQYQYQNVNPYVRYRWMNYKDKVTPVNENIHQMVTLGLRKSFRQSLNIYIEGEVDRKEFQGNENQRRTSGKIGLTYYYPPRFSCWGEIIYSHLKERGEDATKNRIEGSLGVSYQLPWDIHLYGDVRYNTIHHPQEEELKSKGFQATLRVTKKFFWGKREKIAGLKPGIETKGYGSVEGVVFNDINANGMQEIGEEGIPNVTVSLEDGSKVKTDSKGSYQFPRVESGSHVVNLDVKRIPADYSIISPEKIKIEVKFRETLKVNFQLIKAGRIEGRVINDLNANGKFDPNEKGIPDVLVLLQPGDNNTYTEEDGKFTFENILPGEYTLKLDPNTLSKDAVFTSPSDLKLKLPVGGDLKDMDFMIHIKPRPIMIGPPKK